MQTQKNQNCKHDAIHGMMNKIVFLPRYILNSMIG
jgi:hypothetical protein